MQWFRYIQAPRDEINKCELCKRCNLPSESFYHMDLTWINLPIPGRGGLISNLSQEEDLRESTYPQCPARQGE